MDLRKEEKKKRKCLKGFKLNEDKITFIVFVILLAIIPASSEGLATLITTLEFETLVTIIRYIFTVVFVLSYLKMVITNIRENRHTTR